VQIFSPLRIKVDTKEEMILQTLLDKHSRAILNVTKDCSKTATEICKECSIPLSTVYRRLSLLKHLKFLYVTCTIRPDGKKLSSYKNRIAEIHMSLNSDNLQVHTIYS